MVTPDSWIVTPDGKTVGQRSVAFGGGSRACSRSTPTYNRIPEARTRPMASGAPCSLGLGWTRAGRLLPSALGCWSAGFSQAAHLAALRLDPQWHAARLLESTPRVPCPNRPTLSRSSRTACGVSRMSSSCSAIKLSFSEIFAISH